MVDKTLTRAHIGELIFQEVGLSRNESLSILDSLLNEVSNTLISGESVKISSFGTFSVRNKNERIGRNPKTGEEVPITPRRGLTFRPSQMLRDRVSGAGIGRYDANEE